MKRLLIACGLLVVAQAAAFAATPAEILAAYEAQARKADPAFAGFSAERGARLFAAKHGGEWSCASCHGNPPTAAGRHAKTGKTIAPLAPAANADRLSDPAKVEKWFKRNCNDVLSRECTAAEKSDVAAFLLRAGR